MPDSEVQCLRCSKVERITLLAAMLYGWPTCCGQTMLLTQTPPKETIEADMEQYTAAIVAASVRARGLVSEKK